MARWHLQLVYQWNLRTGDVRVLRRLSRRLCCGRPLGSAFTGSELRRGTRALGAGWWLEAPRLLVSGWGR